VGSINSLIDLAQPDDAAKSARRPACIAPGANSASAQAAYLHLGTPSYTHDCEPAVVLLLTRAPRHCSFSRTHEASRADDSLDRVNPRSQDPRELRERGARRLLL